MKTSKNGFVYLIEAEGQGLFKIGYTSGTPLRRLKSLQTGSPYPLRITGIIPTAAPDFIEKILHEEFASFRQSGEWFKLSPLQVQELLESKQGFLDPALESKDFVIVENKYLGLRCSYVNPREAIRLRTERCPFCAEHHIHGAGNGPTPKDSLWSFGHRSPHCLKILNPSVLLPNGDVVYQKDGYWLLGSGPRPKIREIQ